MSCENGACTFRTEDDIYRDAINVWGAQNRISKLFEEQAELTVAICHHMENRDGVGFLPDLWENPTEDPAAVARLCAYYGLNPQ